MGPRTFTQAELEQLQQEEADKHVYVYKGRVYAVCAEELMHPGGHEVGGQQADHPSRAPETGQAWLKGPRLALLYTARLPVAVQHAPPLTAK